METLPLLPGATAAPQSATADDRRAVLASDFDTFLKLLTTQARNQDPLNPLDATDYATQLATFSSVEQQVQTNDLLRDIGASIRGATLDALRSWTGAQVLAAAPAQFDGTQVRVFPDVAEGASSASLTVKDAAGTVVARVSLPDDGAPLDWDGTTAEGKALPQGAYSFETVSYKSGEVLATRPARVYADVVEARSDPAGGITLVLAGGSELSEAEATGIRVRG